MIIRMTLDTPKTIEDLPRYGPGSRQRHLLIGDTSFKLEGKKFETHL